MAVFYVKNSNGRYTLRLTVTETATSEVNNTSTVSYVLALIANTSYYFSSYRIGYAVALNGKTVASLDRTAAAQQSLAAYSTLTLCSGTYTVSHDDDGALDMPVSFSIDMASVDYTPGPLSGSGTMTLTTIARASTAGAASANIGEVSTITVTRRSSAFSHSIQYTFGSLSGYIKADGSNSDSEVKMTATSIAFTVPETFYAQIPSAKSGVCTLTVKTYSGSAQIGNAQTAQFTATAAQSVCKPTVSATAKDTNTATVALTGSNKRILKGYSSLQVVTTATAKNGASISSITVTCGSQKKTGTSVTFAAAESATVSITAKDSRGYSTTVSVSGLTLVSYFKPIVSAAIQRKTQSSDIVQISAVGKWFNGSLGSTSNTLTVEVRYKPTNQSDYTSYYAAAVTKDGESYTGTLELDGLDYKTAYHFQVRVSDLVCKDGGIDSAVYLETDIPKGTPIADWGQNDFAFHVPVYMDDVLLDYPVERGTSGVWGYTKYLSGAVVLAGMIPYSGLDVSKEMATWYRSSMLQLPDFPFELEEGCTVSMYYAAGDTSALIWCSGPPSTTDPGSIYLIRASTGTTTGTLHVIVHGKIKQ